MTFKAKHFPVKENDMYKVPELDTLGFKCLLKMQVEMMIK